MSEELPSQSPSGSSPPPLAALFLIKFDLKVGYTISWKSSLPDVPLEGVVEYKSLPSGLHNVKEDLVYFVHEQWAGVSAFRNVEAEERERGARFLSVGALVAIGDGRLGRCWEHAGELRGLAQTLVEDQDNTTVLEEYWETHKADEGGEGEGSKDPVSPSVVAKRRNRALSSLTVAPSQQTLPEFHPAYSILGYLDTFGPLSFALHRAALLRKRILIVTPAPVRLPCEFVYDLSILSSLPHSLSYTPISPTLPRLQPLFNIGIHDIPYLSSLNKSNSQPNGQAPEDESQPDTSGWIACTTDDILAMKSDLYDVLVELPHPERLKLAAGPGRPPKNKGVGTERWPTMKLAKTNEEIKASQRDLRRYRSLRRALAPLARLDASHKQEEGADAEDDDEETHLLFSSMHGEFPSDADEEEAQHRADEEKVTERTSWSEVAYSSFIWWASAGEREEGLQTEDEQDSAQLGNLPEVVRKEADRVRYRDEDSDADSSDAEPRRADIEMGVIAYFHRASKAIFETAEAIITERDDGVRTGDEDGEEGEGTVMFESEDLRRCGLDTWSERDRRFITEFVDLWFGREVDVKGLSIECCGLRVC